MLSRLWHYDGMDQAQSTPLTRTEPRPSTSSPFDELPEKLRRLQVVGLAVAVLVWVIAALLAATVITGCDGSAAAPGEHASADSAGMCSGYFVTSSCPGAPTVDGMPAIGCHDDEGRFVEGCTYAAGPAGHETTSVCVKVCPGSGVGR
jgi:hypothetical protein